MFTHGNAGNVFTHPVHLVSVGDGGQLFFIIRVFDLYSQMRAHCGCPTPRNCSLNLPTCPFRTRLLSSLVPSDDFFFEHPFSGFLCNLRRLGWDLWEVLRFAFGWGKRVFFPHSLVYVFLRVFFSWCFFHVFVIFFCKSCFVIPVRPMFFFFFF